jgi:hypothetical protein
MRLLALAFVAAGACETPLLQPDATTPAAAQPDAAAAPPDATAPSADVNFPPFQDPDCKIFNPTACRLDVEKTSVVVGVSYPNLTFCRLQLLPTRDSFNTAAYVQLASQWQVSVGTAPNDQTVVAAEMPQGVLEYPLGPETLYYKRMTFVSRSEATLSELIANALGPDVSLFAVPLECPGRRAAP